MLYDFQYSVLHRMTCTELLSETSGQASLLLFRLFTKVRPRMGEGTYAAKHEVSHDYSSANKRKRNGRIHERGESAGLLLKET
jgi:hypothetical protein